MTNQEELNHLFLVLDNLKRDKEVYEDRIKTLIADKDLPVESRWNLFTAFCKLFKTAHKRWKIDFTSKIEDIILFREPQRGELITVEKILDWSSYEEINESDINEFKEFCMKEFIYSYENDW